jgi:hypothetical protein
MGTNYYYRTDICKCCNRYTERHIGKKSYGWEFSFRGYQEYDGVTLKSWIDWKNYFQANYGKVFNEYGDEITIDKFIEIVEKSRDLYIPFSAPEEPIKESIKPQNHFDYCQEKGYISHLDWKDDAGWSFYNGEFS